MTGKVLDVFSLRDSVVDQYRKFATSFTTIQAEDIRRQVEAIYADARYWPEPLIQVNPNYKRTTTVDALVAARTLHPQCAKIFRTAPTTESPRGEALTLFKHQEQAIALASQGDSFVVTTGTGSGKSLCFFIPIVDAVLRERPADGAQRTRAIVIYPMNALANSQMEELDKFTSNIRGEQPITFARYTGQEGPEERRRIADNPPDKAWVDKVGIRQVASGLLAGVLKALAERDGIRLTTDGSSRSVVTTSTRTPPENQIDPWFQFEARLALQVLAALPPHGVRTVEAGIAGDDRDLLEAGVA